MTLKRPLALSIPLLMLLGCAHEERHPSPYFAGEIIKVPENQRDKYWTPSNKRPGIPTGLPHLDGAVCARIRFIIDSNGNIYDPTKLAQVGPNGIYPVVLQVLSEMHFTPAPENLDRKPVDTVFTWGFVAGINGHKLEECFAQLDGQLQQPGSPTPSNPL